MRRFAQFLLAGCVLVIPALAQRGGGGFRGGMGGYHGGGFVGPGFRDGYNGFRGEFRGGYFPGNPFAFPIDRNYPYVYPIPEDKYSNYDPAYWYPGYDHEYSPTSPVVNQSPPKVTEYTGPGLTCPQANGKALYRIAIPPDRPDRERKIQLTYQNNIWVANDYWYKEGTVNFVTLLGERKQTPINSINRALTLQLNRECDVNFEFPR